MIKKIRFTTKVLHEHSGKRLDHILHILMNNYSRSLIKQWIIKNFVQINNKNISKPKKTVFKNDIIFVKVDVEEYNYYKSQNISINIVYEDKDLIIINKPPNLVVHPGAGNQDGTLLNALLYHFPKLIHVPRAGIIHRLDKDTTGLMVIAKNILAQTILINDLKKRKIIRKYQAIVKDSVIVSGKVNQPIKRHYYKRTQMMIHPMGKSAVTYYSIIENFHFCTRLRLVLQTGRTHQIRLHMASVNHPIIGDPVYGRNHKVFNKKFSKILNHLTNNFKRQALHADILSFIHPITKKLMEWKISLPKDIKLLIDLIKINFKKKS
ncbi:23S rRNA pseudouridine(1911/1915/1917) synthase RluD [Candidatus Tachikawaea gelatinosa]|uniref:Pseudouridine synthase n=1 Tax=Candidatus Tachikawaea gelatinosa TaxID=1410383 RepID=A0A090ALW3_9ENTR|nr:23S rRNA pseudouridine(1911/1915/1917) synthase RluD [Candidatus Tachikawaea gelatinosa]BAP58649.1 pseudouridine synthase [Candidatus Tachikawaea gelatinosa]